VWPTPRFDVAGSSYSTRRAHWRPRISEGHHSAQRGLLAEFRFWGKSQAFSAPTLFVLIPLFEHQPRPNADVPLDVDQESHGDIAERVQDQSIAAQDVGRRHDSVSSTGSARSVLNATVVARIAQ
jgi:hypothetical protein